MSPKTKRQKTKDKYRAALKREVLEGPGIWCTCPMGKEKQAIGELYDVLDSIADELWPPGSGSPRKDDNMEDDEDDEDLDLEQQLAKELSSIKKPQKDQRRFKNIYVDTKCLAFISCRPPADPVKLVQAYFEEIERTKRARTRNVLRLSPIEGTCAAHPAEIVHLARKLFAPVFQANPPRARRFKIQLKVRNNSKPELKSEMLVPEIAKCVPLDRGHVVDLQNPEIVVLIEIYQAVCGIAVVSDWIKYKRYNVVEYTQSLNRVEPTISEISEGQKSSD